MTVQEFSNEFDLLWDNLRYNNSSYPSLNEYEKSVFLTQAQEELVKNYFNPKGNKYGEGFGDSDKRDIDLSELIVNKLISKGHKWVYNSYVTVDNPSAGITLSGVSSTSEELQFYFDSVVYDESIAKIKMYFTLEGITTEEYLEFPIEYLGKSFILKDYSENYWWSGVFTESTYETAILLNEFDPTIIPEANNSTPTLDNRIKKFNIDEEIFFIINENLTCILNGTNPIGIDSIYNHTTVKPLSSTEYEKLSAKVYFTPPKRISWRLITGSSGNNSTEVEILTHSLANYYEYIVRFVKRPAPIILENLVGGVSINGVTVESECELNPIIHREILDRAVILAKNAMYGDLNSSLQLEQRSE